MPSNAKSSLSWVITNHTNHNVECLIGNVAAILQQKCKSLRSQ